MPCQHIGVWGRLGLPLPSRWGRSVRTGSGEPAFLRGLSVSVGGQGGGASVPGRPVGVGRRSMATLFGRQLRGAEVLTGSWPGTGTGCREAGEICVLTVGVFGGSLCGLLSLGLC